MKLRNTAASALPPKFQQKYDNICQHMKTIKLYGWESVFVHEIGLGKADYVTPPLVWLAKFIMSTLNSSLSEIAASLAIISQLRPDSSLSYVDLTIILSSMSSLVAFTRSLGSISDQLNQIAEAEAVVKQIVDAQRVNYIVRKTAAKDTAVKMKGSEFSWGKEKFSIRSSALEIKQGEFVAIVGKVGCGKSSIVSALCGEMPLVKGEACILGSIGYVSQKPWIMNGTFRENVLLGSEYDEERYKQIIEACALVEDLAQMPAGDMSEIGHAGINLSGGQKTRLALARAIYMEAKVFILDDLLSAVDAHVERHLVEHVLVGNGLLADKTRILVTHAEHVVPLCDKVITIDHGDIIVTAQTKVSYNGMPVQDPVSSVELAQAGAKPISQETKPAKSGEFTVAPELDVPAFNQQTLWSNPHSFGPGKVDMMMRHSGSTLTKLSAISFADIGITMCLPSLSRFYVYTEQLGREAPHVIKETQPSANWPAQGAIEFRGYSMRYRSELDTVLDQLSFTINGKEKVGIVGRTGAGKSSLTYALLRLVEPAMGSVFIDGIDTSTVGLHTLRSNISIVPQDPVLFEGTIRDNLDPRREYTDAQVWEAIEKAKISYLLTTPTGVFDSSVQPSGTTLVRNPIGKWIAGVGLDKWVSLNGTNFSVGERQLVSLCRALLWQRAILIMDEATANIDSATDQIMQAVIREEFRDKTVLTIAHRLNTVMSCDRILVMDAGKVQEFDSPSELLSRDSHFSRLVESMKFNEQTKE
ncbi:hypothetical protein H4218_003147 [Coemansia sp. IMI 209128]|nr:hypothetical protein H4218_003147 [Coemansia sp. IMI 209128]